MYVIIMLVVLDNKNYIAPNILYHPLTTVENELASLWGWQRHRQALIGEFNQA